MSKKNINALPAYTTVENILSLIDIIKRNSKNEDSIKALFGKAKSAYDNTKSSLKTFGIIEKDSFEFTEIGRDIAFSSEDDKKEAVIKIVKSYEPYELVLNSILASKTEVTVTDIDTIKNLWGMASIGSTERNRTEGTTLFMSIMDFIEFGNYLIGRGNKSTRIEWVADIKEKIESILEVTPVIEMQDEESGEIVQDNGLDVEDEIGELSPSLKINNENVEEAMDKPVFTAGMPNITIKVDMSEWPDEKIKLFFKYAYGKFEEE